MQYLKMYCLPILHGMCAVEAIGFKQIQERKRPNLVTCFLRNALKIYHMEEISSCHGSILPKLMWKILPNVEVQMYAK